VSGNEYDDNEAPLFCHNACTASDLFQSTGVSGQSIHPVVGAYPLLV
jgi:hypothetical protein